MKKFSVNLLKVGVLLIIGLCMMGAMSSVNANGRFVEESTVKIKAKETYQLTLNERPFKVLTMNEKGEQVINLNGTELIPDDVRDAGLSLVSKDPDIATVDGSGKITAKKPGNTTITFEIGDLYKEEVNVEVEGYATVSGLGNGLRGILDFIMKAITKIVGVITKLFANIPIKTILPK